MKTKNVQLLELAKERSIASDSSIVGEYKHLLHDVIQDGGYDDVWCFMAQGPGMAKERYDKW